MTEAEKGLVGLGTKLVSSLPAQFLGLLVVNLIIVGGMFWLEDQRNDARERVLQALLTHCLQQAP